MGDTAPPWYYDRAIRIPVYRRYHLNRARAVCEHLPHGVDVLLDVGCDGGTLTKLIAECSKPKKVIGIDIKQESIEYARRTKPGIDFYVADAYNIPLPDSSADVITLLEVLEHLDDPTRALRETYRVMKPGGTIIVLVPNEQSLLYRAVWWLWVRTFGRVWRDSHSYRFNRENLVSMLREAGFRVKTVKNINLWLILAVGVKEDY